MRAITVCVDYSDFLAVTLPWNRHHFSEVLVVTAPHDADTKRVAVEHGCMVYETEAFYRGGALFNKWLALEEGLDAFGRRGWLCLIDPDILWPKRIAFTELTNELTFHYDETAPNAEQKPKCMMYGRGTLLSPRRRLWLDYAGQPLPQDWTQFPLEEYQGEHAGYSQVFHVDDPVLGPPPWHQTDWRHAGGADSFFQMKWAPKNKLRPPFEVLHLGTPGVNWCGRTEEQKRQLRELVAQRPMSGFAKEKL